MSSGLGREVARAAGVGVAVLASHPSRGAWLASGAAFWGVLWTALWSLLLGGAMQASSLLGMLVLVLVLASPFLVGYFVQLWVAKRVGYSLSPADALNSWGRWADQSRTRATFGALPVALALWSVGGYISLLMSGGTGIGAATVAVAQPLSALVALVVGYRCAVRARGIADSEWMDAEGLRVQLGAALGVPAQADALVYTGRPDRSIVIQTPPQTVARLTDLETGFAQHCPTYEVLDANATTITVVPVSKTTAERRANAAASGGLVIGLEALDNDHTPAPTTPSASAAASDNPFA